MKRYYPAGAYAPADAASLESATYLKVTLRLIPFLFICYVTAYLDRVNVGFAKLQMLDDLQFSEAVYGLGAGIFFFGYLIFEVPSNLLLHRIGARVCISRIMISWGLISGAMMFVNSPATFYVLRFLLGVAEAGFLPGVILYLTYWYPPSRRAKVTALFMSAIPMAGVVGGPLSGWIMVAFAGVNGWAGWQWMFLIEAVPSVLIGLAAFFYLDDGIRKAKWLSEEEKTLLENNIAKEAQKDACHSLRGVLGNAKVWLCCLIYFCFVMGVYGVSFWLPSMIKASGIDNPLQIGLLSTIPYAAAVVGMILVGRHADRTQERRWHLAIPAMIGALGLVVSAAFSDSTVVTLAALTVATFGIMTTTPLFWSLPTAFLGGAAAAAGIAMINSLGSMAGFVSPYIMGWIKQLTGSHDLGIYLIAVSLLIGAGLVLAMPRRVVDR
jgi:D-galactonate transporter